MELEFRLAQAADCKQVYIAAKELLDKEFYSFAEFESYWKQILAGEFGKCDLWVSFYGNEFCAYICANYYPIPRYIGFGIELEEVVTLPPFQRKGIGKSFITDLISLYAKKESCRKISIKTNDRKGSGRLYSKLFVETNMVTYQNLLNKL